MKPAWLLVGMMSSLALGSTGLAPLLSALHLTEELLNDLIPERVAGALLGRPQSQPRLQTSSPRVSSDGGRGGEGGEAPTPLHRLSVVRDTGLAKPTKPTEVGGR